MSLMVLSIYILLVSPVSRTGVCTVGPQRMDDSSEGVETNSQAGGDRSRGVSYPMMLNILSPMADATTHQCMQVPRWSKDPPAGTQKANLEFKGRKSVPTR